MKKTIYELELHEDLIIRESFAILRVPGGWIYRFSDIHNTIFIPFDKEFAPKKVNLGRSIKPIEARKDDFVATITTDHIKTYGDVMIAEFVGYWSECSVNKMRFEFEKTFEIERRLKTWHKRSKPLTTQSNGVNSLW